MARRFSRILDRMGADIKAEVGRVLFTAGEMIAAEAQVSITTGSMSGKNHKPSAPGEPPNNFTGTLAGNIEVTQPEQLKVEVSSSAPYSAALEFGTSKMAARPFMAPAANAKRQDVEKLVAKAVSRAIRRNSGRS